MFKLYNFVHLILYICGSVLYTKAIPCRGTATYKLQFQAEWTNSTHRPVGAGFSGLIGCSHNKCYQMWKEGERASLGVKNVAENGNTQELQDMIRKLAQNRTTSLAFTQSTILPPQKTSFVSDIYVNSIHPLVSVIGTIMPSPDWFIGVRDFDLCDRRSGTWFASKQVTPVYPYDAGTDAGTQFTSSDNPNSPQRDISRIYGQPFEPWTKQERQLGVLHFSRVSSSGHETTGEFQSDENFQCPNKASHRHISCMFLFAAVVAALFI